MSTNTLAESLKQALADLIDDNINTELKAIGYASVAVEAADHASDPQRTESLPRVYVSVSSWSMVEGGASTSDGDGNRCEEWAYNIMLVHGVKAKPGRSNVVAWNCAVNDCLRKILEANTQFALTTVPSGQVDDISIGACSVDPFAGQEESNQVSYGTLEATVLLQRITGKHGGE